MPIKPSLIEHYIKEALKKAAKKDVDVNLGLKPRATCFIKSLASSFRQYLKDINSKALVFNKDISKNSGFTLKEFLYDISVLETDMVRSAADRVDCEYITKASLILESELSNNSRDILLDFGKLAVGCADVKVFICRDSNRIRKMLETPAKQIGGQLYLFQVPSPDKWENNKTVQAWEYYKGSWQHPK